MILRRRSLTDLPTWLKQTKPETMPLNPNMIHTAVRVIGDVEDQSTLLGHRRDSIGTGFLVSVPSSLPGVRYDYAITAHHVLEDQTRIQLAIPKPLETGLYDPVEVKGWEQPFEDVDLAIAPFQGGIDGAYVALACQFQLLPFGVPPPLASDVYYIGILTPLDRPMVRSGTLGALYQTGIKHAKRYDYVAHLVDCRSYSGFSGSPCFVEFGLPVLEEVPIPFPLPPDAPSAKERPRGVLDHVSLLCGLFTEHLTDPGPAISRYGVGVMLPSDYIWRALVTDERQAERQNGTRRTTLPPSVPNRS